MSFTGSEVPHEADTSMFTFSYGTDAITTPRRGLSNLCQSVTHANRKQFSKLLRVGKHQPGSLTSGHVQDT